MMGSTNMPLEARTIDGGLWNQSEQRYLSSLAKVCDNMAKEYMQHYDTCKSRLSFFRLPSIVVSSVSAALVFGIPNFGEYGKYVRYLVGCSTLFVSIITSTEAFLGVSDTLSHSLRAAGLYRKLHERILTELHIAVENRMTSSVDFVRECFAEYQNICEIAPPMILTSRGKFWSRSKKSMTCSPLYKESALSVDYEASENTV